MLSHSLSFESILAPAVGFLVLLLFVSMLALVSVVPDPENDDQSESENEFSLTSVMQSLEIEH